MKDKKFLIKIADLLNETGRSDEMEFDHKTVDALPTITAEGISGKISMQSVNEDTLLCTLTDVHCTLEDVCDSCGTTFLRTIDVPEYVARFAAEWSISAEEIENADETILLINPKDETIDISDMVTQAITLNDPFVKRCPSCDKKFSSEASDEDDLDEYRPMGNISFS